MTPTFNRSTAPTLPVNYIHRTEALNCLRQAIKADARGRPIALTTIQGMGGIGKSVLARALCDDETVQKHYPDGIVWLSIGRESGSTIVDRMREFAKVLGDPVDSYDTPEGC